MYETKIVAWKVYVQKKKKKCYCKKFAPISSPKPKTNLTG